VAQDRFSLHFERSGGLAGMGVRTDVDSASLAGPDATQLRQLLAPVDFGKPMPPPRGADRFQYDITLERGGRSQSLTAYDGSMPPELKALADWLVTFSRRQKG
jgi:hypothetical protein